MNKSESENDSEYHKEYSESSDPEDTSFISLNKEIQNIRYIISDIKSQTVDVIQNLNNNVKEYNAFIHKFQNEYKTDKISVNSSVCHLESRVHILEHEIKSIKQDNQMLFEKMRDMLTDNSRLFGIIFDILKDLETNPGNKK
ncbi:hypothetical protein [Acanthamoeba castellanii mimivirus]|uniref:Uncharacterized protein L385 n=5 Tax=Mimivirus TaxID=315393 RepID=YL385_MIMIV|nr:hypothetical protein MIMI_gp0416 [Acanthamoeba polyphaga mimivirus]Q5UQW8.1 RecName: Full=Uncharacterized protein L385 [Acanthamoeba polyphaga mimivirus]AEQ60574.1 hypothetical protein [Acanthamoeba castellanii mamavirus]AHA45478.1 hypothetical protein HIRU_S572 [Hirudovirus strain Sangsue]AHJ40086.1 hypothetical protein [Samba virus]ALR83965.1 hypothetical protein [Niemeyer virus]AMZ02830.1 hypothetical protein [Mimivirus Bombay]EJN40826.1 hypothetical protein lvs_L322 [Acanthamoeba poly